MISIKENKENVELIKELIEGTDNTIDYEIPGASRPFKLRPLKSTELMELQVMEKKGQVGKLKLSRDITDLEDEEKEEAIRNQVQNMEIPLDYAESRKNQNKVKMRAISLSAGMKESLIGKLQPRIIEDMFLKIMEISEFTDKDLDMLDSFPKNR